MSNVHLEVASLYSWQDNTWRKLKNRNVWVCSRQIGKSTLVRRLLLQIALETDATKKDNEFPVYWYVSPTYSPNSKKTFERLCWMLKDLIAEGTVKAHKTDLMITLPRGTIIECKSADKPQNLRGDTLWGVVFDETGQLVRTIWDGVVSPMLDKTGGWAIFLGTPGDPNEAPDPDWFEELHLLAESDPRWGHVFEVIDTIKDDDPNQYRRVQAKAHEMPEIHYQREYYCKFPKAGEGGLDSSCLKRFAVLPGGQVWRSDRTTQEKDNFECLIIVDLALTYDTRSDPSGVSCYVFDQDTNWFVLATKRLRGDHSEVITEIYRQWQLCQDEGFGTPKVGVERAGGGQILMDSIRDEELHHFRGLMTKTLRGDNKRGAKFNRIIALEKWLTNERMFVRQLSPEDDTLAPGMAELINEMDQFPKGLETKVRQIGLDNKPHHYEGLDCAGYAIQGKRCPPPAAPAKKKSVLPEFERRLQMSLAKSMRRAREEDNSVGGYGW